MYFATANSTYELDHTGKRIRRLEGAVQPTPRQGSDGAWKQFASISRIELGAPVLIVWCYRGAVTETTCTSPVQRQWETLG